MNLDERLLKIDALLKQVTLLTWNSLPEERRNPDELQNEALRLLARALDNFADDQRAFDAQFQRNAARGRNPYARLRESHPNAGKAWTAKDDEELRRLYAAGNAIDELAPLFARTKNGVRQRLVRLGLIDDAQPPNAA
jgi:hypothetical protein